jgi:NAD(P)-dependent dehydrogenase (short-subunit alcohol dehydrogenase family)
MMKTSLNTEIAIVTGAGQGIGRAIALRLARDDYFVIIADMNEKTGRDTVNAIGQNSSDFILCDVGDETSVKNFYKNIRQNNGNVTVLVNNAGIIRDNVIWKMSASEFDAVIRVNLRGTWLMCREAAGIMRENRKGRIINIASRAWLGNPGQTNYSASKAGIVGLTRALALELAKYDVTVNAVAPGLIDTPLTGSLPDQVQEKLIAAQPTKSMGQPEDIAETVVFLASGNARFITGQVFHVDGGKSIGSTV